MPTQTTTIAPSALAEQVRSLRARLASTHVGLEGPIDRLLNAAAPWLLLGQAQRRPRIIGLWGMTGTGKSSLVRSLVEALGLEDRTFWLDAGVSTASNWLDVTLELAQARHNGKPFVLVIDEFQHARTIRDHAEQIEPTELRRLWELIDAGRLQMSPHQHWGTSALRDLHDRLESALSQGVVVHQGLVRQGGGIHDKVFGVVSKKRPDHEHWFVPKRSWEQLRDSDPRPMSMLQVKARLAGLDGPGTLEMLTELIDANSRPVMLDASKALVFVLGNLDPLYTFDRTPLPELDPDVLMHRHRAHTATGIQAALLELFRVEQVARLGSDHIVFPPMAQSTIMELAFRECERVSADLGATLGMTIQVDGSLLERLQREASIAILGARPVVEAVNQMMPGLVGQLLMCDLPSQVETLRLALEEGEPVASLQGASGTHRVRLEWPLQRGLTSVSREQVHTQAVHEAGHLLCGVVLNRRTPLQACARTSSDRIGGFVAWASKDRVPKRSDMVPHLAQLLGGWVAEKLVFGHEQVTAGSGGDFEQATEFVLDMVKSEGFGSSWFKHAEHPFANGTGFRSGLARAEAEAREILSEAEKLAESTLAEHRELLVHIADAMAEKGSLNYQELQEMLGALVPSVVRMQVHKKAGTAPFGPISAAS